MFPNLAGNQDADKYIIEELTLADIELVRGTLTRSEVPYIITGRLHDWTFERGWKYWVAEAKPAYGLPLDIAIRLHEKEYPIPGNLHPAPYSNKKQMTYGQVVRVAGHCGCPHPREWAHHYDAEGREVFVDPQGKIEQEREKFLKSHAQIFDADDIRELRDARYVRSIDDAIIERSVMGFYHIDTQLGLKELADAIRANHAGKLYLY
jgi:hypothetical protein